MAQSTSNKVVDELYLKKKIIVPKILMTKKLHAYFIKVCLKPYLDFLQDRLELGLIAELKCLSIYLPAAESDRWG